MKGSDWRILMMLVSPLDDRGDQDEEEHGDDVEGGVFVAEKARRVVPVLVAEGAADPGDGDEADHPLIDRVDAGQVEGAVDVPDESTGPCWGRKRPGR